MTFSPYGPPRPIWSWKPIIIYWFQINTNQIMNSLLSRLWEVFGTIYYKTSIFLYICFFILEENHPPLFFNLHKKFDKYINIKIAFYYWDRVIIKSRQVSHSHLNRSFHVCPLHAVLSIIGKQVCRWHGISFLRVHNQDLKNYYK